MTSGTGQPGREERISKHDPGDRTLRTGYQGQRSRARTAGTARPRQQGQGSRDRTTEKGQPGQDSQDRITGTGQLGHISLPRLSRQVSLDRTEERKGRT